MEVSISQRMSSPTQAWCSITGSPWFPGLLLPGNLLPIHSGDSLEERPSRPFRGGGRGCLGRVEVSGSQLHRVPPTLQQATADPCLCQRFLDTHRQVSVSLLWGYCSFLLDPGVYKVLFVQQYVNDELWDVQAGFRKGRGTRDQIANICWIIKRAREFQKKIYFCFIDYSKAFDCVDHNKLENSSRDGNTRPPYLPPEKSVCRSRSNS